MNVPKWLQDLQEKRKIKQQEELIRVLRQPQKPTRRPAAKFASNRIKGSK